jgi:uncharacterized damage-inducible protein DinB
MDAPTLTQLFNLNQRALKINLEGISDEESRLLPPSGNSINWVVGHIVSNRQGILELAGETAHWTEADYAAYERGSNRLDPGAARPLAGILADLDRSQEALVRGLERMGPAEMAVAKGNSTVGAHILFLQFHEAYHVGQTGLLRRLIGKTGAIR